MRSPSSRSRTGDSTFSPRSKLRPSCSPRTSIASRHFSRARCAMAGCTAVARATPRASSPRRSRPSERLRAAGERRVGLLFVVGEERGSDGAVAANNVAPGSRFLVNGEPTGSKLATGTRGILRVRLRARGRAGHSSAPEQFESAIEKLVDARRPAPRAAAAVPTRCSARRSTPSASSKAESRQTWCRHRPRRKSCSESSAMPARSLRP